MVDVEKMVKKKEKIRKWLKKKKEKHTEIRKVLNETGGKVNIDMAWKEIEDVFHEVVAAFQLGRKVGPRKIVRTLIRQEMKLGRSKKGEHQVQLKRLGKARRAKQKEKARKFKRQRDEEELAGRMGHTVRLYKNLNAMVLSYVEVKERTGNCTQLLTSKEKGGRI